MDPPTRGQNAGDLQSAVQHDEVRGSAHREARGGSPSARAGTTEVCRTADSSAASPPTPPSATALVAGGIAVMVLLPRVTRVVPAPLVAIVTLTLITGYTSHGTRSGAAAAR